MNITFTVNLPPEVETRLRADDPELSAAAREGYALELFRRGVLDRPGLGQALGLDRFETGAFLKRHQLFDDPSHEEIDAEVKATRELIDRSRQ